MSTIGLFSLHASPGVTTLALGMAGCLVRRQAATLLLEADPDGGVVAARHDVGLAPNLTDLAAAARRPLDGDEVLRFAQPVGPGVPAVVAHPSAEQTRAALANGAAALAPVLVRLEATVLVDLGRWRSDSPARPLADAADRLLLVVRPTLEQTVQALHLLDTLTDTARVHLVVVGDRPYSARQVADTTGVVQVSSLPFLGDNGPQPFAAPARRRDRWATAVEQLVDSLGEESGSVPSVSPLVRTQ